VHLAEASEIVEALEVAADRPSPMPGVMHGEAQRKGESRPAAIGAYRERRGDDVLAA
jgi:hypothetical protein